LAQIYEHQGQLDAAQAAYRRTVYLDSNFVLGTIGMANIWRQMKHRADAQRYYRNALQYLKGLPQDSLIPEAEGATAAALIQLVTHHLQMIE
jgi:chemotaxis protein methyltransferase CheR